MVCTECEKVKIIRNLINLKGAVIQENVPENKTTKSAHCGCDYTRYVSECGNDMQG